MPKVYGTKQLGVGQKALKDRERTRRAEQAMERIRQRNDEGAYEEAVERVGRKYREAEPRIMERVNRRKK